MAELTLTDLMMHIQRDPRFSQMLQNGQAPQQYGPGVPGYHDRSVGDQFINQDPYGLIAGLRLMGIQPPTNMRISEAFGAFPDPKRNK
jgi:hypothetical protein